MMTEQTVAAGDLPTSPRPILSPACPMATAEMVTRAGGDTLEDMDARGTGARPA